MVLFQAIEVAKRVDAAFITLFAGLVLGRLAGKACARVCRELEFEQIAEGISDVMGYFVSSVVYGITVVLVLQQFRVTRFVLLGAGGLFLLVLAVLVLFALADVLPNLLLGLLMHRELSRHVGKRVRVGLVEGELVSVGWLDVVVKQKQVFALPYRYVRTAKFRVLRAG